MTVSVYQYVRVCFFEKFPRNITLNADYLDEFELASFFEEKLREVLRQFNIAEEIPVDWYAWAIFNEFRDAGLVDTFNEPAVGDFYWADLKEVGRYMTAQLAESDIYERKNRLRNDRLYEAVFARVGDAELTPDLPDMKESRNPKELVPASDRIVTLNHNRPEYTEIASALDAAIEKAQVTRPNDLSGDAHASVVASLESARSLWNAFELSVLQVRVGIFMAIESAQSALKTSFELVKGPLLMEALKAFFRSAKDGDIF